MAASPLGLHRILGDPGLIASLPGYEVVGLAGVVGSRDASRTYRARRASVPGAAVSFGYRWRFRDAWDRVWWPQGIAVGTSDETPLALVSWYAQPRRDVPGGVRISIVDLSDPARAVYRHVRLVSPRHVDHGVALDPVLAHAGGIAWSGDRLLVAATFDGIREFRLSEIRHADRATRDAPEYVLPQFAYHAPLDRSADDRLRYSFLTIDTEEPQQTGTDSGHLQLVVGEYSTGFDGRVARLELTDDRSHVTETHVPGIRHMQGAATAGDTWFVSSSQGERPGDLWVGRIGAMSVQAGELPPGPEALARWPARRQLWSVSEIPGKRWIFAMDTVRLAGAH